MVANPGPFAVDIEVNYKEIESAIFDGLNSSRQIRRALDRFLDDIEETWKVFWDSSMEGVLAEKLGTPHPYATGSYRSNIKKRKFSLGQRLFIKRTIRRGIPIGMVYNDDDKAHWIEYGTADDNAGSESPWGPYTPTPVFAPMQRTLAIMNDRNVRIR